MKLKQLLKGIEGIDVRGSKEVEVSGISIDSRSTSFGHLFIAKKGSALDGTQFIQEAIGAGAAAILTDIYDPFIPKTQIIHPRPQELEALLAARFYQRPSEELFVVGATGTKGKTTSTYIARHLLDELRRPCGLIGTVETIAGKNRFFSTMTTHDAVFNQKLLKEMVSQGCRAAVLEVSSHGLLQNRVEQISFDVALFTNLSPDHLDYHKSIEEYAAAKKRLFALLDDSPKKNKRALLNADSPWTNYMREGGKTPSWTFGIEQEADVRASEISFDPKGTRFRVSFQGKSELFETGLIGRFNVYNVLGAIALGLHLGAELSELKGPIGSFGSVPGRLERVNDQIFVDFAHTGDSLDNVLKTLREITPKRLIVIFGCGGNRDPARRTGMAKAAEKYADLSIVTSDNPRQEEPEAICRQILEGFEHPKRVFVELDRKAAIFHGVQILEKGDVLLIAGKGHERVQIFAHKTIPFDDVAVAVDALHSGVH
ncbi:MAG: UDP-N-acetylmuramoyl-L-alanyl-D-glutamate--2,6-diaminopimelate ligase [Verrucomicrobia bacterium]|nr:UDP-N-acetylmuramoyl-L-alanyl-D-glutamate--2,6-diaminopimelate ligase [Verrucomicrobiota bacterium]